MDLVRIGRACRALRIRRRWRQSDVAKLVGVSRQLVAKIESGDIATVQLRTLEAVVQVLGGSFDGTAKALIGCWTRPTLDWSSPFLRD